jgi:beta-lactamase class C
LASVSKGFAGILACMLENDSLISLDEKIVSTIPGLKLKTEINTKELTLKHTLNHTSGLAPHAFDNLIESGWSMSAMIKRLPEVAVAAPPGQVYGYQNAIYSLIDTVVRVKLGKSYRELLSERIFAPLGMTDASLDLSSMIKNSDVAYPHRIVRGKYVTSGLNPRYYNVAPAAGVNASISDLSKWLKALLGANPQVIDSSIINRICTPLVNTPLKKYAKRWGDVESQQYSLGWRIFKYMGHTIIYHGGFVQGYRAEIAFCPEEKTGIVFLQNSPNALAAESVPEFWKRYFTFIDSYKLLAQQN